MAAAEEAEIEIQHDTRAVELVTIFQALASQQNSRLDLAWAKFLGAPPSSFAYYASLASISRSLGELSSEITTSNLRPASKEQYLEAVDSLQRYVAVDELASLQVNNLKQEKDAFRLLTLLDDVLQPTANRNVSKEALAEWRSLLDGLIDGATEAFGDETLRQFIVWNLTNARWAIDNFDTLGIDGLSRSYGAMASELARSQGMKGAQTPAARKWYQTAKKPLLMLGAAIAATSAVAQDADKLLTHSANIFEVITGDDDDSEPSSPNS